MGERKIKDLVDTFRDNEKKFRSGAKIDDSFNPPNPDPAKRKNNYKTTKAKEKKLRKLMRQK